MVGLVERVDVDGTRSLSGGSGQRLFSESLSAFFTRGEVGS